MTRIIKIINTARSDFFIIKISKINQTKLYNKPLLRYHLQN